MDLPPLTGITAGPVSPFRPDFSLDAAALERNAAGLAEYPFCAMLIAAGIGEFYSLTPHEIVESMCVAARAVAGRMPLIGTVAFGSIIGADLARRLEKAGASALLVMPPYFTSPPEEGLARYYEAIGNATGLPLMLYSRDWAVFAPEAVARLAERIPTLAAWKDGQGDIRRYQRIMHYVGDRLVWLGGSGDDCIPGYFAIGIRGFTSSLCNFAPRLAIAMGEAAAKGDLDELNRLAVRYAHPVFRIRDRQRGYDAAAVKAAMEMFGLTAGPVRPPLAGLRPDALEELHRLKPVLAEMRE